MSVVEPIAEYDTRQDIKEDFVHTSPRKLAVDTNFAGGVTTSQMGYSYGSTGSADLSTYDVNPIQSWEKTRRRNANVPTRPNLSVLTDAEDESRQDQTMRYNFREPHQPSARDSSLAMLGEDDADAGEDEPSRTRILWHDESNGNGEKVAKSSLIQC